MTTMTAPVRDSAAPHSALGAVLHSAALTVLARLAVGGMFAYTAIMKLRDPILFLKTTKQYRVVPLDPPYYLNITAITTPYIELVCALALLVGFFRRGAALVIAGMLLFFTPMLAIHAQYLLQNPPDGKHFASFCEVAFDCGCGTGVTFICRKLAENIALLGGALLLVLSRSDALAVDGLRCQRHSTGPSITVD